MINELLTWGAGFGYAQPAPEVSFVGCVKKPWGAGFGYAQPAPKVSFAGCVKKP